jgi:AcrR family transcriptional regulator
VDAENEEQASPPKLRRDAVRNRARLIESAKIVFRERGRETTLDDIAAHAGLGVATAYRNYPNKKALLEELFEEPLGRLLAFAADAPATPNAWDALIEFIELVVEVCAENPVLAYEFAHVEGGLEGVRVVRERLFAPISQLVQRAKDEGRLRADFQQADIEIINTMLVKVIEESHLREPDLWRRYFALIVDGLQTSRNGTTPLPAAPVEATNRSPGGNRAA